MLDFQFKLGLFCQRIQKHKNDIAGSCINHIVQKDGPSREKFGQVPLFTQFAGGAYPIHEAVKSAIHFIGHHEGVLVFQQLLRNLLSIFFQSVHYAALKAQFNPKLQILLLPKPFYFLVHEFFVFCSIDVPFFQV